jgi:hypothetical protein
MDPAPLPLPGAVATWCSAPLVVAARVDGPADAAAVLVRLRAEHPGIRFITVVSVAEAGALAGILDGLAPVLAERVFAMHTPGSGPDGHYLAMAALEVHGVGQDFVFEVATVPVAVGLARRAISPGADVPWEGTALLVPGSADVLEQARAALAEDSWGRRVE